jgi:hypothetical protein
MARGLSVSPGVSADPSCPSGSEERDRDLVVTPIMSGEWWPSRRSGDGWSTWLRNSALLCALERVVTPWYGLCACGCCASSTRAPRFLVRFRLPFVPLLLWPSWSTLLFFFDVHGSVASSAGRLPPGPRLRRVNCGGSERLAVGCGRSSADPAALATGSTRRVACVGGDGFSSRLASSTHRYSTSSSVMSILRRGSTVHTWNGNACRAAAHKITVLMS